MTASGAETLTTWIEQERREFHEALQARADEVWWVKHRYPLDAVAFVGIGLTVSTLGYSENNGR